MKILSKNDFLSIYSLKAEKINEIRKEMYIINEKINLYLDKSFSIINDKNSIEYNEIMLLKDKNKKIFKYINTDTNFLEKEVFNIFNQYNQYIKKIIKEKKLFLSIMKQKQELLDKPLFNNNLITKNMMKILDNFTYNENFSEKTTKTILENFKTMDYFIKIELTKEENLKELLKKSIEIFDKIKNLKIQNEINKLFKNFLDKKIILIENDKFNNEVNDILNNIDNLKDKKVINTNLEKKFNLMQDEEIIEIELKTEELQKEILNKNKKDKISNNNNNKNDNKKILNNNLKLKGNNYDQEI